MISEKLLSLILEVDIKKIYKLKSNPNLGDSDLPYSVRGIGDLYYINIYELAHKCKEWAYKQNINYGWLSPKKDKSWNHNKFACYINNHPEKYVFADTEPEAIFKACEWILQNAK